MPKLLPVKWFTQKAYTCGPASLQMVLHYYGLKKSQKSLELLTGCTFKDGTSGEQMVGAAQTLGFQAQIKDNCTFADIREYVNKKKMPVIVDFFYEVVGHYSVVVGIDAKRIYICNPLMKKTDIYDLVTFDRIWFDFRVEPALHPSDLVQRRLIIIEPKRS